MNVHKKITLLGFTEKCNFYEGEGITEKARYSGVA